MKTSLITFALLFAGATSITLSPTPAVADLQGKTAQLCEKIKTCALAKMAEVEMDDAFRAMMTAAAENMCNQVSGPFAQAMDDEGLKQQAEACIDATLAASCEVLMSESQDTFPACQALGEALDAKDSSE